MRRSARGARHSFAIRRATRLGRRVVAGVHRRPRDSDDDGDHAGGCAHRSAHGARAVAATRRQRTCRIAVLPLLAGTLVAYFVLIDLPGWSAPRAQGWLGAAAIGLCLAVSALPVLIGIVRELRAGQRVLGNLALKVAVLDDAALWCGLALLLLIADGRSALDRWSAYDSSPWRCWRCWRLSGDVQAQAGSPAMAGMPDRAGVPRHGRVGELAARPACSARGVFRRHGDAVGVDPQATGRGSRDAGAVRPGGGVLRPQRAARPFAQPNRRGSASA